MKKFARILSTVLAVVLVCSTFGFVSACKKTETYKVTFKAGTTTTVSEVKPGEKVKAPANPSAPAGQKFYHWYLYQDTQPFNFDTPINQDVTITAFFYDASATDVVVTYQDNYDIISPVTLPKGYLLKAPVSDRAGYIVDYWELTDGTHLIFPYQLEESITLKGYWVEAVVVTFDTDGGTPIASVKIVKGGKVDRPADPERSGYIFDGWVNASGQPFDFGTAITSDITIRAKWSGGNDNFDPLVLNTGDPDGKFTPFFSSSAYDSSIVGQTQISMLTSQNAEPYAGDDVPTVAYDFNYTTYVKGNDGITREDTDGTLGSALSDTAKKDPERYYTEYNLLIKNNIKFSNGKSLTIADVLFNMYVFLDPVYSGSSTMYSTNIIGLSAYREDDPDLNPGETGQVEASSTEKARTRINNIISYYKSDEQARKNFRATLRNNATGRQTELQILKDVDWFRTSFYDELKEDWNALPDDCTESFKDYGFTQKWQAFLLIEGMISAEYNTDGTVKEEDGEKKINWGSSKTWYHDSRLIDIVFNETLGILGIEGSGNIIEGGTGNPIVDVGANATVDIPFFPINSATQSPYTEQDFLNNLIPSWWTNKTCRIGRYVDDYTPTGGAEIFGAKLLSKMPGIVRYSASGNKAFDTFKAEEFTKIMDAKQIAQQGKRSVPYVKGITVESGVTTFRGQCNGDVALNGAHNVLKIRILGVDPKAIWNFGFSVAPMEYYSNPQNNGNPNGWSNSADGYGAFKYPGVNGYTDETVMHPGFRIGDKDYFDKVINSPLIQGVPVGGGCFMATDALSSDSPVASGFLNAGIVYFKRNNNFVTVGGPTKLGGACGLNNAKFPYLRYQVLDSTKTMDNVIGGIIHYADPNVKQENVTLAQANSATLGYALVANLGYGYVGVNAKFVPDVEIRKAIMTAMNKDLIFSYYTGGLAEPIHRPMSKEIKWAYPAAATDPYPFEDKDHALAVIDAAIKAGNYYKSGGLWVRNNADSGTLDKLEFTFTIAGSETDHPAYQMFLDAADLLNSKGIKVNVSPSANALIDLAAGKLAVWAAAWSSTIDPDMYQVYHKNSKATSVKAWGYEYLLQFGTTEEKQNINELSSLIEAARETTNKTNRARLYNNAMNIVMDLAYEYPTYQRQNLFVYDKTKINAKTLNANPDAFTGLMDKIWQIELLK